MPSDFLYLYQDPFLVEDTLIGRADFLIPALSDRDKAEEKRIHQMLLNFAQKQNVITFDETGIMTHVVVDDMSSWIWLTQWVNFRSLVDKLQCVKLMQSLQVRDSEPINQLIDLHVRLGCLFEGRLLNTLCHRTLSTVSFLPYEVSKDSTAIPWYVIHKEQPFLWLLILTQALVNCNIQ